MDGAVYAFAPQNSPAGPALYAAGYFTHSGFVQAKNIIRWSGSGWQPLGAGVGPGREDQVFALCVFDDGTGPAVYAGGDFGSAGAVNANHVARWDGAAWSPMGTGTNESVFALAAFNNGGGSSLYVGGGFTAAGGTASAHLARWGCPSACYPNCDGSAAPPVLNIFDLICFLNKFAAGDPYANCDGSTTPPVLNVLDFRCFLNRFAAGCP